jgi:hypothetical protein
MHIWRPDPARPPAAVPESVRVLYSDFFVSYPLVAKKFELHDLTMQAAGLVQFDGRHEDKDGQNLAQAAEMVFDRGNNSYEIYEALEVLSLSAYDVNKVSFSDLGILRDAMTEIMDSDDPNDPNNPRDPDDPDDVGDDVQSVLSPAVKVIDSYFEKCSKGSPHSVLPGLEDDDGTPRIEIANTRMEE